MPLHAPVARAGAAARNARRAILARNLLRRLSRNRYGHRDAHDKNCECSDQATHGTPREERRPRFGPGQVRSPN